MKQLADLLKDDGYLFIGVPNFETNPADLFTYDHLSCFSFQSISYIFELAGFEIIDSKVSSTRVPMWYLLRKTAVPSGALAIDISDARSLTNNAIDIIKSLKD